AYSPPVTCLKRQRSFNLLVLSVIGMVVLLYAHVRAVIYLIANQLQNGRTGSTPGLHLIAPGIGFENRF
ncbi:MAG: hypothetical protein RBT80_25705, partial [Candidatus Vecturithrix sp.]|nr:hypothetical protein [Candidatus Vecturithrix sp.]